MNKGFLYSQRVCNTNNLAWTHESLDQYLLNNILQSRLVERFDHLGWREYNNY